MAENDGLYHTFPLGSYRYRVFYKETFGETIIFVSRIGIAIQKQINPLMANAHLCQWRDGVAAVTWPSPVSCTDHNPKYSFAHQLWIFLATWMKELIVFVMSQIRLWMHNNLLTLNTHLAWDSVAEAAGDVLPNAVFCCIEATGRTIVISQCGNHATLIFVLTSSGFFWQHNRRRWWFGELNRKSIRPKKWTRAKYVPCFIGFVIMCGEESNLVCPW